MKHARVESREGPGEQPEPSWHALPLEEVEGELGSSSEGLPPDEVGERLRRYGANRLPEPPRPSDLAILLHQFRSPLIYILLVAAIVTLFLREYIDSGVIAAVLVLNAAIGFTQERKAEESVRALMQLLSPRAVVVRGGEQHEVESEELVPGDVVLLESGTRVPADLRLSGVTGLQIDESLLTGESLPVHKGVDPLPAQTAVADRRNRAHTGTVVTRGRGRGYVVATGENTEIGAIAEVIRTEATLETPLQRRMTRFAHVVALLVGAGSVLTFLIGVLIGEPPGSMFLVAVALAVAVVPEGLPVVFTITLALGVRRMSRRRAIVRRLPAVETLGSTTTIGSDKTGTLTENRMTVQRIWTPAGSVSPDEGAELDEPLRMTLLAGVLSNEAEVRGSGQDMQAQGDPTEVALLVSAQQLDVDPARARSDHESLLEVPFESDQQYSASVRRLDGRPVLFVKGAPERVLGMSRRMFDASGEREIDPDEIHRVAHEMAAEGFRVLAMAFRELDDVPSSQQELGEPSDLVLCGMQGMQDPPREGVREAIEGCRSAGIRVVMITGDHAVTARSIARVIGISASDDEVLTGAELEKMDDADLAQRVGDVSVYARVSPQHKHRIVNALQAQGEVVAITGDGVNDAPALKAADIGVAMGRSGTDVAREASDMVLTDDNFISIYGAVEEGRITFDNVRKVTFFLMSTGAAALVTIPASMALGWPLPMLPAQLLWLNLVTNGLQDVALAFEPGEEGVLERPPRARDEGVVSKLLWERIVLAGLVMAVGTLILFRWELDRSGSLESARTVALTTMVLFMAWHAGNARSEARSVFRVPPFSNPFLLFAVLGALALHAASLYLRPTQFVLRMVPLEAAAWGRMLAVSAGIVAAMEVHKLLRGRLGT